MENTFERVERLLALLLIQNMKGATKQEKAIQLNLAGFSNVEIADILQTSGQVVAQLLYVSRRARASRAQ